MKTVKPCSASLWSPVTSGGNVHGQPTYSGGVGWKVREGGGALDDVDPSVPSSFWGGSLGGGPEMVNHNDSILTEQAKPLKYLESEQTQKRCCISWSLRDD